MLQAANTDFFNPLIPKARKNQCQNILFPWHIKPLKSVKAIVCGFLFFAPSRPRLGTIG